MKNSCRAKKTRAKPAAANDDAETAPELRIVRRTNTDLEQLHHRWIKLDPQFAEAITTFQELLLGCRGFAVSTARKISGAVPLPELVNVGLAAIAEQLPGFDAEKMSFAG